MTDKEIEVAKEVLYNERGEQPETEDQKRRRKVLWCIEMINSIIAYGGFGRTAEEILQREEKSYHNYLAEYVEFLGRDKVLELINEQLRDIVGVRNFVYTDYEGCSYNSIVWAR